MFIAYLLLDIYSWPRPKIIKQASKSSKILVHRKWHGLLKLSICMGEKEECMFGLLATFVMLIPIVLICWITFLSIWYDIADVWKRWSGLTSCLVPFHLSCIDMTCTQQCQCGSLWTFFVLDGVWRHRLWTPSDETSKHPYPQSIRLDKLCTHFAVPLHVCVQCSAHNRLLSPLAENAVIWTEKQLLTLVPSIVKGVIFRENCLNA